jgi:heptosyltransferase-1
VQILIIKLSAIGDVIHTLPALTTLARHLPRARIDWVVEDAAAEIVRGHAAADRVLVWERQAWREEARGRRIMALGRRWTRFARLIRERSYDLAIDFQGLAKSAQWMFVAKARRKAGFGRGMPRNEGAWLALNERVKPVSPDIHALDRGLLLLEALGFPRLPLRYDLPVGTAAREEAERLLGECGIQPEERFVAVNPATRWPTKDWDAAGFAAVADQLRARGMPVVFTGSRGDRAAIDAINALAGSPAPRLDGRTSLKTLAAVFERAAAVLSTDTGPMHLAAAVEVPVIALFGPTAPWRTGPYGPQHRVLRVGVGCSPCFSRVCRTDQYEPRACMLRLKPEEIVGAVMERAKGIEPS